MGPPNLRHVVRRFEVPATLRRFAAATIDSAGLQARGAFTETTVRVATWPAHDKSDRGPGGQQDGGAIEGVSRTLLRSADTVAGDTADVLLVQGSAYEVDTVRPWPGSTGSAQFWEFTARSVELELDYPIAAAIGLSLEVAVP